VDISIPVKMNLKTTGADRYPIDQIIGTVTDFFFCEGVFESLQELGVPGNHIHLRENPRGDSFEAYGIVDMALRAGIDFRPHVDGEVGNGLVEGRDFSWHDVPDGKWFTRIPQLEPINHPNTWLLNISKFKAHGMGLTLCSKNLQGIISRPFTRLCSPADSDMGLKGYIHGDAIDYVRSRYERHRDVNRIPRWDRPGGNGGIWQEVWTHRTLDNLSVTPCGLNIIEGIFGRDGDAGNRGPHPFTGDEVADPGKPMSAARDYMHNMIVFGKDIFRTDIVGHYLGGHEPGNFGFFHIAIERGMSDALDPRKIPVYLWENGSATLIPVESFNRTPLLTYYLQRDYGGETEPQYHMVDEPFDYSQVDGVSGMPRPARPEVMVIHRVEEVNGKSTASIEYSTPISGFIRLELSDSRGNCLGVPVQGYRHRGTHMAAWDTSGRPKGMYSYRLRINSIDVTGTVSI